MDGCRAVYGVDQYWLRCALHSNPFVYFSLVLYVFYTYHGIITDSQRAICRILDRYQRIQFMFRLRTLSLNQPSVANIVANINIPHSYDSSINTWSAWKILRPKRNEIWYRATNAPSVLCLCSALLHWKHSPCSRVCARGWELNNIRANITLKTNKYW